MKHEPDCPTRSADAYFHKMHEISDNINVKFNPANAVPHPDPWNDWLHQWTAKDLEKMRLVTRFSADLTHVVKNPVVMQPSSTQNLCSYNVYYISPTLAHMYMNV